MWFLGKGGETDNENQDQLEGRFIDMAHHAAGVVMTWLIWFLVSVRKKRLSGAYIDPKR